eukprot:TRINITY_DN1688_c7_g1_i1.p1 TRINITY_DN1688_c7_g1~~TRINITY_DN1688_c7_g1_i1.p1  ORF type:complete len:682 (+),score=165.41 TRINITY_DN1688_c7_g1_i1:87-2048(+)
MKRSLVMCGTLLLWVLAAVTGSVWEGSDYVQNRNGQMSTTGQFICLLLSIPCGVLGTWGMGRLILERGCNKYADAVLCVAMTGMATVLGYTYGPWLNTAKNWNATLACLGMVYCGWVVATVCCKHINACFFPPTPPAVPFKLGEETPLNINTVQSTAPSLPTLKATKILILTVFLPTLFLSTTVLPNSWGGYTPAGVKAYLSNDGSTGRAISARLGSFPDGTPIYMKVFPDVAIYYLFLWFAVLAAVFRRKWVVKLLFVALFGAWVWYWATYSWLGGWRHVSNLEKAARTLGQVGSLCVSLTYIPVGFWVEGLGFEKKESLRFHRWIGRGIFLVTFVHMACFIGTFTDLPRDIFMTPKSVRDNFTVPAMFYTWVVSLFTILLLSLRPVRTRFFEVFYFVHIPAVHVFTFVVFLHAASLWFFLAPGLLLYFIGKAQVETVYVQAQMEKVGESHVSIHVPELCVDNMVVKVMAPQISGVQWHPFSVVNPYTGRGMRLIVKSQGDDTWTGMLHDEVPTNIAVQKMPGTPDFVGLQCYEKTTIVCGGVGITYGLGLLTSLLGTKTPPQLIWVCSSQALEQHVLDTIMTPELLANTTILRRADFASREIVMDNVKELVLENRAEGDTGLVCACGPASLVRDLQIFCEESALSFHEEVF